jgi:hypothetical protein
MVSIFNLIGIAGLRCYAINNPRKIKNKGFQYFCIITPIMGWVATLTFFLPILTQHLGRLGLTCNVFVCVIINVDTEENPITPDPMMIYLMVIAFSGILLISLNIVTYVQVSKKSKKLFSQIKETCKDEARKVLRNEKRLGKMVGLITASFMLVYVPLVLLMAFGNIVSENPIFGIISCFCAWILVVIDPLLYIYSSEKYRNGIKMIINPRSISLIRDSNLTFETETPTQQRNIS